MLSEYTVWPEVGDGDVLKDLSQTLKAGWRGFDSLCLRKRGMVVVARFGREV